MKIPELLRKGLLLDIELVKNKKRMRDSFFQYINEEEFNYFCKEIEENKDYEPLHGISPYFKEEMATFNSRIKNIQKEGLEKMMLVLIDEGNVYANYMYGFYVFYNMFGYTDHQKGLSYIVKAAIKECPQAQEFLGRLYYDGNIGLEKETGKSYNNRHYSGFWRFKAAINGNADMQYLFPGDCVLGKYDFYYRSDELFLLEEISGEQGNFNAQFNVLQRFLNKDSPKYDFDKGIALAKVYVKTNAQAVREVFFRLDLDPLDYGIRCY